MIRKYLDGFKKNPQILLRLSGRLGSLVDELGLKDYRQDFTYDDELNECVLFIGALAHREIEEMSMVSGAVIVYSGGVRKIAYKRLSSAANGEWNEVMLFARVSPGFREMFSSWLCSGLTEEESGILKNHYKIECGRELLIVEEK